MEDKRHFDSLNAKGLIKSRGGITHCPLLTSDESGRPKDNPGGHSSAQRTEDNTIGKFTLML